ncbi:MAG: zinc-dependent alcohol dehydrogenase family protein [Acidobacteriaceae bacterium]|nr:zinc-dependent alcohol dehydrogenase family protein [Acidobacteriaceae bacterium]MBV9442157.1 zinc-dependent alcohol dehydrogenase family protein [Acidobacteriaceae bacterium]
MPKIVRFHKTGPPEVLKIEDLPLEEPKENEVRLKAEALGLNRAEALFRMGAYLEDPKLPARLGYEASGTIDKVGPGVSTFKPGDRVSVVPSFSQNSYGMYAEYPIAPLHSIARYPDKLSAGEGTSIWMQYFTAWGGLNHYGRLSSGQSVLITAASSSVGIAAIELVRLAGAHPIAVTRSSSKKKLLADLGAEHVIVSAEEDLVASVKNFTRGKGIELIFDPVAGKFLETLAATAAPGAQIIEYGLLSGEPTPFPLHSALAKGLSIRGYTLFEIVTNPELREKAERFIFAQLETGMLKPKIDRTFPFEQIVDAHRHLESNSQVGKVVVTIP